MTSNNHFRILDLPGELRNRIYEAALVKARPVRLERKDRWLAINGREVPRRIPTWEVPALLHTSRQVRAEAMGIYLSSNTFDVHPWYTDDDKHKCLTYCVKEQMASALQILEPKHRLLVARIRVCGIAHDDVSEAREAASVVQVALKEAGLEISRGVVAAGAWPDGFGPAMWITEDTEADK